MKRKVVITESKLNRIIAEAVQRTLIEEGQKTDQVKQYLINLVNKFGPTKVAAVLGISLIALCNSLGISEAEIDKQAPVHIAQSPDDYNLYQDGSWESADTDDDNVYHDKNYEYKSPNYRK